VTYPRYVVDVEHNGHKLQAWPHGYSNGTWSWCVQHTRPGDYKPPNLVGRNRPGWPEFHHRDDAFAAAGTLMEWARALGATELLPVAAGLRMNHRLGDYMEEREKTQ
jgi:hypothetical protein